MTTMDRADDAFDEFAFVADDAARLGLAVAPSVRRWTTTAKREEGLSALVWGDGAPQAAFLHGGGLNAHSWDSAILALGRPAIAIDLPGHGDSDWRDSFNYQPQSMAPPVAAVLEQAIPGEHTLVGQSLGGLTAIAAAGLMGERVTGLVIVDISPGHRSQGDAQSRVSEFIAGPESYASRAEIIDRALAFGMGRSREDLERGVLLNTRVRGDGRVVFKNHLASPPQGARLELNAASLWPILETLRVPVLLVYGRSGLLNPGDVDEFVTRVPGSTALVLDAGHNVQRDAPEELAAAINDFIHLTT